MRDMSTLVTIRGRQVEIDNQCIPLVDFFNSIGLDTKFCCEGHKESEHYNIMFENYINDEQILSFLNHNKNRYGHTSFGGKLVKWCRSIDNDIVCNWMYIAERQIFAMQDHKTMVLNSNV